MSDVVLIAEPYGSVLFSPEVPYLIVQWPYLQIVPDFAR